MSSMAPDPYSTDSPPPDPYSIDSPPPDPYSTDSPPPDPYSANSPLSDPYSAYSPPPDPYSAYSPPPDPYSADSPTPNPYSTVTPTSPVPTLSSSSQLTPIRWAPTASLSPPLTPSNGLSPGALAGLIVGIVGAIIVVIGVGIFVFRYWRKKRKEAESRLGGLPSEGPKGPDKPLASPSPDILGVSQGTFTYEELEAASDGFSDANLIGQGGFGYVHKGVLRDGRVVAIKQLKAGSAQGEREFQAEIDIISRVHHRHLVSLFGYCITGVQRMLVYEFVPNNTLEFHLHGKDRPTMNWSTRMKIALGSAKGLAYLHEDCHPKIIHRDIKAANILLDNSFEAKVADFGLAKYSMDSDTHVSTRVMGTFGYMAPEYASSGKLTKMSDVFSFGVVLLELITRRRPFDGTQSFVDDSIVDWARPLLKQALEEGIYGPLVDPKLQEDYDYSELTRMLACAAACIRHSARLRPQMNQIVRALEGNWCLDVLSDGVTPAHSTVIGSYGSLKKFRKMALETREHGSSDYSGATSDCGLHPFSSSSEGQQTTQ